MREFNQGEPPKEFATVPEGWYIGKIDKVNSDYNESTKTLRLGFGVKISEGEFVGRFAWLNMWVSDYFEDKKTGERTPSSNFQVRKLQAIKDPNKHPLKEAQPGEVLKVKVEDDGWFEGIELGFNVVHEQYQKDGEWKIAAKVKKFMRIADLDASNLSRGRDEGGGSSFGESSADDKSSGSPFENHDKGSARGEEDEDGLPF